MRLYVLGLNNPQGNPPLHTAPAGGAGHRLWALAHAATGLPEEAWLAATQRCNLLSVPALPRGYRAAARRRGTLLAPLLARRTVVLLGGTVARAMGCPPLAPLAWHPVFDWVHLPHPSGKNLWYNNPVHRAASSVLWRELLEGCDA